MKKMLIIAAASAALAIPSAAMANHPLGDGPGGTVNQMNPDGFKNRGQCEAALAQETNRQRQNPDERVATRQDQKSSDFQHDIQDRFVCEQDPDGNYRVYLAEDLD